MQSYMFYLVLQDRPLAGKKKKKKEERERDSNNYEVKTKMLAIQSCPTLCCPMECSPKAPLSMGFSRQKFWSG